MSNYYKIQIGNIHEEHWGTWIRMCKVLKEANLLDYDTEVLDQNWMVDEEEDDHWKVMNAIREGEDYMQFVPDHYDGDD